MKTKLSSLLAALFLPAFSLPAANIYWVSFHSSDETPSANAANAGFATAPDVGYTRLLAANGHTVTRYVTTATPDTSLLNTADLVIISRSVPSSHYQNEPSPTDWNGITVPMMILNGYITRGSRLGLTTGDTIPDVNRNPIRLRVNAPGHPIFNGVALDANNLMVNPYAQIITFTNATTGATTVQRGISVNTSPVVAGASVLAVVGTAGDAAAGGMIIGEYPEGLITQPANALGAKRIVFYTGSREQSITSEGAGIYDLLPDGAQLFLNAVNYTLTTDLAPLCTVPLVGATNLVAGDAWTFSAGPIGSPPLTYQWYKDGQALPEATEPALAFTSLVPADAGAYQLIVANSLGSATSTVARLEFAVFPAANITNSIITYWPLNEVVGNKTVDLVSGYDMTLVNMGQTNIVPGKWGNAFQFDNASQTILQRINNPGEDLPIYAKLNFSVSLWVNGPVQTDHRVFSEGSTVQNNALFNIGTHNGGADGSVDSYIRTDAGATSGDHRHSTGIAFDST